jgi:hypothetical protein
MYQSSIMEGHYLTHPYVCALSHSYVLSKLWTMTNLWLHVRHRNHSIQLFKVDIYFDKDTPPGTIHFQIMDFWDMTQYSVV